MTKMIFAEPLTDNNIPAGTAEKHNGTWKIIISDDDEQVHEITKLALTYFSFAGKELEFLSAFSGQETKQLIMDNPDVAIILQDVVMETDTAGLDVVKYVREELKNKFVRIILRTGQPGQAPERKVIVNYDINDYKEKTELTSQKLFTLIYSSIRSFQDINTIERNKDGLQQIIDSSSELFSRQSIDNFYVSTMQKIAILINEKVDAFLCSCSTSASSEKQREIKIISTMGELTLFNALSSSSGLDESEFNLLQQSLEEKKNIYQPGLCIIYFSHSSKKLHDERLLFFKGDFNLTEIDKNLINLYMKQASISYDNLLLYHKVEKGQQEIVNLLGTSIETRSKETGNHIKRVAEISALLAEHINMEPDEIEILKLASPLHDLGKIGIPDAILNKPGKLDPAEWQIMMTHAKIGHEMLCHADSEILQAGAIISHEHHEKWDGFGYPEKKQGEEIHIYGRITAVADVFDALAGERCYKKPWPMKDIIIFFKANRGIHFEPRLVDVLLDNIDQFIAILDTYKD